MESLVSIIVPYYNTYRAYLDKCLASLLGQTYAELEILVVDDGSKPEFADALDKVTGQDERIRVIHKPNGGVSSARNEALKLARGRYICFVDSDDWVEPDFVRLLVDTLEANKAQLAACNWVAETGEADKSLPECPIITNVFSKANAFSAILHSTEILGFLWNKIFEKDFITQGLNEGYHYCEDLVFVAHYIDGIERMAYTGKRLYHYRQTGGNATGNFSYNSKILTLLSAYQEVERFYTVRGLEDAPFVEKSVLKIALNIRARYLLHKVDKPDEIHPCMQVIKKKLKRILLSRSVPMGERVNIFLSWLMPVAMFRLKCLLLKRKIE